MVQICTTFIDKSVKTGFLFLKFLEGTWNDLLMKILLDVRNL